MNELTNCLICSSQNLKKLKGYERDYLKKCENCDFVFSGIRPSLDELEACYLKYPRLNKISQITIKRYNENLNIFENYRKTGKILDVGAGEGWFLAEAMKRDWQTFATEFDDRAVSKCLEKGISVKKGILDPDNYTPGSFDVITSFEVIEHIQNPVEEFTNFHNLLRPGGILYVSTPNFNSISHAVLGPDWNVINYPEHLSYYTPKTLKYAFRKVGFKVLKLETSGISIDRLSQSFLQPHSKKTSLNTPLLKTNMDERARHLSEENIIGKLVKRTINLILDITNRGDAMKAILQKV